MDNYFNYHAGLNLAVFSKKAMKHQQWNNLPGWLQRSPFGAITGSSVVSACGGLVDRSSGRWLWAVGESR